LRSLRARVFVTVAVVLAAATAASGLLSRRATLVEEREIVAPREPPPIGNLAPAVAAAYRDGGWPRVRVVLETAAPRLDARLIAIDAARRPVAASSRDLESASVHAAGPAHVALDVEREGARSRIEVRGAPALAVRDAQGIEAGRVYVLPAAESGERALPPPFVPAWLAAILGTGAVALLVAFAVSGRILRPVGELTAAARRMREGDLTARVRPRGDDEMARLARAFNEMAERLAHTERTKRQLVSDVAHELRSPVTNLRCSLEAIQDGLAPPDRARVDALHAETLLLQRLIADLQDLALADAGGLMLERVPVDVGAAIERALGADRGGARVIVAVDPDARRVIADAGRLEQMLRNLIGNARRHTPPDGAIRVRATRHGGAVRIAVADTGCGIAAEHLPYVFERFYRADASRDRATGGAGLGLAIVRRLAEAQGGRVSAVSDGEGRGATFTIELPTAVPSAER
jgi:two-component system sensor histidine kinase BaeS